MIDGTPPQSPTKGMVWIPGGTFRMGSDAFYPEERPVHVVTVDGFWMDRRAVTNTDFGRFIAATGYVTVAERPPNPNDYLSVDTALMVPGSLVFRRPPHRLGLYDHRLWWTYVPGACWSSPEGPGSNLEHRADHPVVHVVYEDAEAYAAWVGKALPTEAEWEFASRGGLDGAVFVWGDEFAPEGRLMANTWQGEFPWQNLQTDGYEGTSPVGAFPANGYGLYDMAANVWEWTSDFFTPHHPDEAAKACCATRKARVSSLDQDRKEKNQAPHLPSRVLKGGSHLCAPNYCLRYRPAAPQSTDSSACHIGFRCIVRT
jgi:formylglycine-generating enzyme